MTPRVTVISAPGKVLLAGGYLVLDPKYSGVVVATSSRFYTIIRSSTSAGENRIKVTSPQFLGAAWIYDVEIGPQGFLLMKPSLSNTSKNKFIQLALERVLMLAAELKGLDAVWELIKPGVDITIAGDNDFYSQRAQLEASRLPSTIDSLSLIPRFAPTNTTLGDVHKTGLGSSAALITSLVCALLIHLSVITAESLSEANVINEGRALAHNVAQYIHCLAQGKVGSGFDVSSATFGSQLYKRFDPEVIQALMVDELPSSPLYPILSPSNAAWNHQVNSFQLPPMTRLMLADVDAGSDTPSLVGKVLAWRKAHAQQARFLWDELASLNDSFAATLLELGSLAINKPETYSAAVSTLRSLPHDQWGASKHNDATGKFIKTHKLSEEIRSKMREMGNLSGVPIEPSKQTRLLDACVSEPGVIGGGVPGAGGYDAVWLLVFDTPTMPEGVISPLTRVETVWANWKEMNVSPLSSTESLERGARVEDPSTLESWLNQISLKA
ncbi:phosphomevalonate kinase [Tulasnella sp. 419]|nr:phosphomevalonate kinase [Tulasnella sp. 419]